MVTGRNLRVGAGKLLAASGILLILVYLPFGHSLVRAVYDADHPVANRLLPHRSDTPLLSYQKAADAAALNTIAVLGLGVIVLLSTGSLQGLAISVITLLAGSLLVFTILDFYPPLARALHFDAIRYFKFRDTYISDAELGAREKPLRHAENHNFRGWGYSPVYGVDEPAKTEIWDTDEEGFRNHTGVPFADVVVLGSSFPPYGLDLEDTYTKRLEKHLNGYIVSDLGMGGYGPIQFVKVFQRFGLPKKPRYAIFAFQTGDIEAFLGPLVAGNPPPDSDFGNTVFGSFWSRWLLVLKESKQMLASGSSKAFGTIADSVSSDSKSIHPDLVVLKLPGNKTERMIFLSRHTGLSTEDLLDSPTWRVFEESLREFKRISEENQIVPLLAYIPWATEEYAEYSTLESGWSWLAMRDRQIATSANDERAAHRLADKVGMELISFYPAFKEAASHGDLVYFRFDSHWNSEGSEIAARVTAEALQAHIQASGGSTQQRAPEILDPAGSN